MISAWRCEASVKNWGFFAINIVCNEERQSRATRGPDVVLKEAKHSIQLAAVAVEAEVVCAKCECCGLTEECTVAYIGRVRERFGGRWICGLCSQAVKDYRVSRSNKKHDDDDGDGAELDALKQHMKFCQQFRSSTPPKNPTQDLIYAVKNLLRRSFDSPWKKK